MSRKAIVIPTSSAGWGRDGSAAAPLQHAANRPILCHVLDALRGAAVAEVALLAPHRSLEQLRAAVEGDDLDGLEITYIPCGPGGDRRDRPELALSAVAELVGEDACVVHAADGLLTQPLVELLAPRLDDATGDDLVAFAHRFSGGSATLASRRVIRLVDDALQADGTAPDGDGALELTGVCLLAAGSIGRLAESVWEPGESVDLTAICERFVRSGARVRIEPAAGWLPYAGSTAELLALNRFLLEGLSADDAELQDDSNRVEGCVIVHPTATVRSSTIMGPAIVGAGAVVQDAYIGPYTSIGARAHIEGAEIERSVILDGARITHIGGRLVGSVVGRDARIFRDFSMPRAMRLSVGDGDEVALC
jgi:glucose-1-phosphate thymidylyltransferase